MLSCSCSLLSVRLSGFHALVADDTHAPLEAPWRFVEPYVGAFPGDTKRQIFSGMLSFVDESVKNLTETLKAQSLWENTLFVWITVRQLFFLFFWDIDLDHFSRISLHWRHPHTRRAMSPTFN